MANTGTSTFPPQEILDSYQFTALKSLSYDKTRDPSSVGFGGFSDVYVGNLINEGRTIKVAIKTVRGVHCAGNLDQLRGYCRRIKREETHLRKATEVWHENIIPFFGVSDWNTVQANPAPGLVSLFCDHNNVSVFFTEYPEEATNERKLTFVKDVAFGLEYLHSIDMIHGDLKPSNVLVKDNKRAAICDFGQARVLTFRTGHTTGFYATHQYTAPELLKNEPPSDDDPAGRVTTAKGDIYAFAMTALEISSGQQPYPCASGNIWLILKIAEGMKPDLLRHHSKTGEILGLTEIITKCWATDPKDRPGCMKDIVEDLGKL